MSKHMVWLLPAVLIPAAFYWAAPANAEWAGVDDRIPEWVQPSGPSLYRAPALSPDTESRLFLAQCAAGVFTLFASAVAIKGRRS